MMQIQQPSNLGQVPLGFYTQVLLGFPLKHQDIDAAIKSLTSGVECLVQSFPFLGGQVVLEGRSSNSSGVYRVLNKEHIQILIVKDYKSSCASFADIEAAKAPQKMLHGKLLSPMKGIPESHDNTAGLPVFLLQLNIIQGGAILCSSCMHQSLDMNGQAQLLNLLAQACAGEKFSDGDIIAGNIDGSRVIPLLSDGQETLKHENFRCSSRLQDTKATVEISVPTPWCYFRFTKAKLAKLKMDARPATSDEASWVSTNDALTAFIWQRLAIARSHRFEPETVMFCDRLVNVRSRLQPPVSAGYMGHMLILDQVPVSFDQLAKSSLSDLAARLRRSLRSIDDYHVRSAATLIMVEQDKSTFQYGANAVPDRDFTVSSWAGLNLASLSFGPVIGNVAFVRRANTVGCEGLAYFMPVTVDGDIDIAISLREVDANVLGQDETWNGFADILG